jgi:putative phosphoribosyl transferase
MKGRDIIMTTDAQRVIEFMSGSTHLEGMLGLSEGAKGVVLFAHGSGSGRFSPRNQFVAESLRETGLGTLLVDLLTPAESDDRANVFDIDLLTERLASATDWLRGDPETRNLSIGYFGASTGAAAALQAAAKDPGIRAVVSRGGRPDLAMDYLPKVSAPTLLIVGGHDVPVIEMNRQAYELLACEKNMVIVPGATHLFEEPGTLEEVARLAAEWFTGWL